MRMIMVMMKRIRLVIHAKNEATLWVWLHDFCGKVGQGGVFCLIYISHNYPILAAPPLTTPGDLCTWTTTEVALLVLDD